MVVDISRISKLYGASVEVDFKQDINDLEVNGQKVEFNQPVKVKGKLTNLGEVFTFEGEITSEVKAVCDRCLKDVGYGVDIKVYEKFTQEQEKEEDNYLFQGNKIDLTDAVINNIVLNHPLQHLCSEECKGLCPQCGVDRNTKECGCNEEKIDPRFEKLKNLFK